MKKEYWEYIKRIRQEEVQSYSSRCIVRNVRTTEYGSMSWYTLSANWHLRGEEGEGTTSRENSLRAIPMASLMSREQRTINGSPFFPHHNILHDRGQNSDRNKKHSEPNPLSNLQIRGFLHHSSHKSSSSEHLQRICCKTPAARGKAANGTIREAMRPVIPSKMLPAISRAGIIQKMPTIRTNDIIHN